jgi:hypothetical protein
MSAAGSRIGGRRSVGGVCTILRAMTEDVRSLTEQLEEIGARLAWVRDYL